MKKISLTLLMALCVVAAFGQQVALNTKANKLPLANNASFNWTETSFDFGKIKPNEPVTHEFSFVNNGSEPLVISSVQASCGCTVAEYSKASVAPGQRGFVKATYNAVKVGAFAKSITVNANTQDGIVQLNIKGEVNQ